MAQATTSICVLTRTLFQTCTYTSFLQALKDKGFNNTEIKTFESENITAEDYNKRQEAEKFKRLMIESFPKKNLISRSLTST